MLVANPSPGGAAGLDTSRRRRAFTELTLRERVLLAQLPLTLSALVATAVVLLTAPHLATGSPHLIGGLAGILVLTAAAGAVPWDRLPPLAFWAVPLLDFAAIAPFSSAARHALDGMSLLAVFPMFWLAWTGQRPRLAICLGVLGSTAVAWWPRLAGPLAFSAEDPSESLLGPVLVPPMTLALAVAASVLTRSLDRQSEELAGSLRDAALRNRMLHAVVETSDVGILVVDRDGNDRLMNQAQRRHHVLGLPPGKGDAGEAELLLFDADGVTPLPAPERPVRRALAGESFRGRIIAVGTDGSQQHLSVSAAPMHDEDGDFDGTVVIFQNVSELIGAVRARDQFVAEVSHEFRTPLTSIIGYLDLATEAELDPEIEHHLTTSIRNAERLLTLVSNLLDSPASTSALVVQEVDVSALVRLAVDSAAPRAEQSGVDLEARLPRHLVVVADALRIAQVTDNLISNAVKYTPHGGRVTVTLRREEQGPSSPSAATDWAVLSVQDTGIGMTEHERSQLFTAFFRTEHVRRAAIPGTGLGLAISQRFVRAHGGEIRVASHPGEGSTFTLRLPVAGPSRTPGSEDPA